MAQQIAQPQPPQADDTAVAAIDAVVVGAQAAPDDAAPQGMQPPQGQMPHQQQALEVVLVADMTLLQPLAAPFAIAEGGLDASAAGVLAHVGVAAGTGTEQHPALG